MSEQEKRLTVRLIAHNSVLFSDCLNFVACSECGADAYTDAPIHLTHDGPHGDLFVYCDDCYSRRKGDNDE